MSDKKLTKKELKEDSRASNLGYGAKNHQKVTENDTKTGKNSEEEEE